MTRRDFISSGASLVAGAAVGEPIRSNLGGRTPISEGEGLPYDSEIEYLESTGTQYIDTGILVGEDVRVDCTFELMAYGNTCVFGGRSSNVLNSLAVWAYEASYKIRFDLIGQDFTGQPLVYTITPNLGHEYFVSKYGKRNFLGGVEQASNSTINYIPSKSCYLFAMNNGGAASFIGHLRIKRFSISGLRDMIPVRFTNEHGIVEGAMYDRVSGGLFRNQGTGSFIIGPDI